MADEVSKVWCVILFLDNNLTWIGTSLPSEYSD